MATNCAIQSGNFTAAGTWGTADATSLLLTASTITAVTTSFVSSSAFTPGAITISGVYVNIGTRAVAASGTFSIRLAIAGVAVAGTTVTINVSDVAAIGVSFSPFWIYMKFSSPVTLVAATAYTLQAQTSVATQISLSTNGTAANWSRALVTTTTAAPASGDTQLISGEHTAAATNATYTVTMDNTATTTWGSVANTAMYVGAKGILTWGTSAATNYYYKAGGAVDVGGGGQYIIGTSGTPMPSGSTATLEMATASANQFAINVRAQGTFKTYGSAKQTWDLLGANAIVGATSLTTTTSNPTGWANGDTIVLAPTTNGIGARDERIINTVSGTTTTITAGLTNAKNLVAGTYGVECEIINLTRNIRIIATSTAFWSQMLITLTGVHEAYYTEFYRVAATYNTNTVGSSFYHYGCSIWSLGTASNAYPNAGAVTSFISENTMVYDVATVVGYGSSGAAAGGPNMQFIDVIGMFGRAGAQGMFSNSSGGIYMTRCRAIGGGNTNIAINNNANISIPVYIKDCIGKCGSFGLQISIAYASQDAALALVENFKGYLNTSTGMSVTTPGWIIDTANLYSNATANLVVGSSNIIFKNINMNAGTAATISPIGINFVANAITFNNVFQDCSMGATTTHANGDIRITSSSTAYVDVEALFTNCIFASSTEIGLQTSLGFNSKIRSARHDQTNGTNKIWMRQGTQTTDSTIYDTTTAGTKSVRLTPLIAASKLASTPMSVAAKNGAFLTATVKVRCSVVGDGVAYNGNRPRLMLAVNTASHVETVDTVLATATVAANGAFETLTATIPTALIDDSGASFYVDCDGTAGWVNIDSWKVS